MGRLGIGLLCGLLLSGCEMTDRFEAVTHDEQLYVLNTWTGEMTQVEDRIKHKVFASDEVDLVGHKGSSNPVDYNGTIGTLGLVSLTARAKRFEDEVLVSGEVEPFLPGLSTGVYGGSQEIFKLNLMDSSGFRLGSVTLNWGDLSNVQDGGKMVGYSFQKAVPMKADWYSSVVYISPTWYPRLNNAMEVFLKTDDGKAWRQSASNLQASSK